MANTNTAQTEMTDRAAGNMHWARVNRCKHQICQPMGGKGYQGGKYNTLYVVYESRKYSVIAYFHGNETPVTLVEATTKAKALPAITAIVTDIEANMFCNGAMNAQQRYT